MSKDDEGETATVRDAAADVRSDVQSVGPGEEREEERMEKKRERRKRRMSGCVSNRGSLQRVQSLKGDRLLVCDTISCCIRFVRSCL